MSIKRTLNHKAVYWAPASTGTGGIPTFDSPVERDVRWVKRHEIFITTDSREATSNAVVYDTTEFVEGGMLYRGELDDLTQAQKDNPRTVKGAFPIRSASHSDSPYSNRELAKAYL